MSYKKMFLNYLIIVLLFSNCFANLELGLIKDAYNILREKDCSPAIGAVLWHKNVLKNFYRFGNEEHETIKLIKALFNYVPETGSFDISAKLPSTVGFYLTPEVLGQIVGILKNKTSDKKEEKISKLIKDRMLSLEKIIKEKIKEEVEKSGEIKEEEVTKDIGQKFKKLKSNLSSRANQFSRYLVQACENCRKTEGGEPYPEFMPLGILETFLYRKADNKEDIRKYFEKIKETIGGEANLFEREPDFREENKYGPEDKKQELERVNGISKSWAGKEIVDINKDLEDNKKNNIEKLIFAAFKTDLPDIKKQCTQTKTDNPKVVAYTDCVETTLLNLVRIVFYNKETGTFDLNKFSGIKKELKEFLEKKFASSEEEHKAWANIVENKQLIIYSNMVKQDGNIVNKRDNDPYEGFIKLANETGLIIIEEQGLRKLELNKKIYYLLDDKSYGWELEPNISNLIILTDELLGLEIFKDKNIQEELLKENFNSEYFKILCEKLGLEIVDLNDQEIKEQTDYSILDLYIKNKIEVKIKLKINGVDNTEFELSMHSGHGEISSSAKGIEEWGWHSLSYGFENIDLSIYLLISCCYDGVFDCQMSSNSIAIAGKRVKAGQSNLLQTGQYYYWVKLIEHLGEMQIDTSEKKKLKLFSYNLDDLSDDDTLLTTLKYSNNLDSSLTFTDIKNFSKNLIDPKNIEEKERLDFYSSALDKMVQHLDMYSEDVQGIVVQGAINAVKEVKKVKEITPENQEDIETINLNIFKKLEKFKKYFPKEINFEDFEKDLYQNALDILNKKIDIKDEDNVKQNIEIFIAFIKKGEKLEEALKYAKELSMGQIVAEKAAAIFDELNNKYNEYIGKGEKLTEALKYVRELGTYFFYIDRAIFFYEELIKKDVGLKEVLKYAQELSRDPFINPDKINNLLMILSKKYKEYIEKGEKLEEGLNFAKELSKDPENSYLAGNLFIELVKKYKELAVKGEKLEEAVNFAKELSKDPKNSYLAGDLFIELIKKDECLEEAVNFTKGLNKHIEDNNALLVKIFIELIKKNKGLKEAFEYAKEWIKKDSHDLPYKVYAGIIFKELIKNNKYLEEIFTYTKDLRKDEKNIYTLGDIYIEFIRKEEKLEEIFAYTKELSQDPKNISSVFRFYEELIKKNKGLLEAFEYAKKFINDRFYSSTSEDIFIKLIQNGEILEEMINYTKELSNGLGYDEISSKLFLELIKKGVGIKEAIEYIKILIDQYNSNNVEYPYNSNVRNLYEELLKKGVKFNKIIEFKKEEATGFENF